MTAATTLTFFPLGNADCCRIDLASGSSLLFDYADMRCADEPSDKRSDLPTELRKHLKATRRTGYDIVAFTHLDKDHVYGASSFFEFRHATKYQGEGRVGIEELWVPAYAICEDTPGLCEDGRVIQAEARYRLRKGEGVRVFSRPAALKKWLEAHGLTLESRSHLITDAGQLVPGWSKDAQGVEFFVHSPFASRQDDGTFFDRNSNSLLFQATFLADGHETRALLMADCTHDNLTEIVRITQAHSREERLEWDVAKLPHHCSYLSLGPDKGTTATEPVPNVAWLYEKQSADGARIISTSDLIPVTDDLSDPPHRQAAAYYRGVAREVSGEFLVTMEHPTTAKPGPLVVRIDGLGTTVLKAIPAVAAAAVSKPAPRAG